MDYVIVVAITGMVVGFITYMFVRSSLESKWQRKWTLGICNDLKGWYPILERYLDNRHWEYIYINTENTSIIMHIAYSDVPRVEAPYSAEKEERFQIMLQDMVNRGHGHITGMQKEAQEENQNA